MNFDVRSRSGNWAELTAPGGVLGLHTATTAESERRPTDCELSFDTDEPL